MLEVKRPTALVFGWNKPAGKYEFISDSFSNFESLMGWVDLFSLDSSEFIPDIYPLLLKHNADVVVLMGSDFGIKTNGYLESLLIRYQEVPENIQITNDVLRKVVENHCNPYKPKFSIFTPAYKTGERIQRTYQSLLNQTFDDWEWVVIDDSPPEHNELWDRLNSIASSDYRVRPHRLTPNSGGKVGMVKKRSCSFSRGEWLVELDHDDTLTRECLSTILAASQRFPDAGFIYSDCTEIESDGSFRKYDDRADWNFYGSKDNYYNFGYSGHSWVDVDGKRTLQHHSPSINPVTIRFNVSMPNHVRVWRKDIYDKIGGHSQTLALADDFELIIRTFLETRMVHIRKVLYTQYNNGRSTVDLNSFEINRLSRVIKDVYNQRIHERIVELGFHDWEWDSEKNTSLHPEAWVSTDLSDIKFGVDEQVLNYVFE